MEEEIHKQKYIGLLLNGNVTSNCNLRQNLSENLTKNEAISNAVDKILQEDEMKKITDLFTLLIQIDQKRKESKVIDTIKLVLDNSMFSLIRPEDFQKDINSKASGFF